MAMSEHFADGRFRIGVGIEDTFVIPEGKGTRSLDEYRLTQHYENWSHDLGLAAEAGATTIRYGLPWYRVNPEKGKLVWDWADRVVDRLSELNLEVILDLVHYGTPLWLDNGFVNKNYADRVADYGFALAERYGDRISAWTPLNEPQWTARFSGELGTWPPSLTGHDGYLQVMTSICRGISLTQQAIAAASPRDAAFVHVEASFRYVRDAGVESAEADLLAERRFLALDLVTGRVDGGHPLIDYLTEYGVEQDTLDWFTSHPVRPDVVGVNYYPMWSTMHYAADGSPGRERDDGVAGLQEVLRDYSARYESPVMITETSYEGTTDAQIAWLNDSIRAIDELRTTVPVVGYIWWPFIDQIKWQYREGTEPVENYLHRLGLVTLEADDVGTLVRRANPVFRAFQAVTRSPR